MNLVPMPKGLMKELLAWARLLTGDGCDGRCRATGEIITVYLPGWRLDLSPEKTEAERRQAEIEDLRRRVELLERMP